MEVQRIREKLYHAHGFVMNRAERIYRLHALLRQRPHSLAQLMEALEVSRATLVRDLGYMRDFMGAPIDYDRASNGYRYEESTSFELPGLWLNESELHALLASERLLDLVQPGLLAPYLGPLRTRLRSLLSQSGHSASAVSERILLQPVAARPAEPQRFGIITAALLEGRQLRIRYHSRSKDSQSDRLIHPQRLLRYRDNWYLTFRSSKIPPLSNQVVVY
jgi:predicted DNA-binding transcriptional regulator YafY